MGPVGHLGIALGGAHVLNRAPRLKLNLWVVAFSSWLPDFVDKPLYLLGIGDGRYVGHTLLFVFLVAAAVCLINKVYGLSVLFGAILHLLLDFGAFVPWLYPFVNHNYTVDFDPEGMRARLSTLFDTVMGRDYSMFHLVTELVGLTIVLGLLCYLFWRYFRPKSWIK